MIATVVKDSRSENFIVSLLFKQKYSDLLRRSAHYDIFVHQNKKEYAKVSINCAKYCLIGD